MRHIKIDLTDAEWQRWMKHYKARINAEGEIVSPSRVAACVKKDIQNEIDYEENYQI